MSTEIKCDELFLEGVTDLYLYPFVVGNLMAPFYEINIKELHDIEPPECALHISTIEGNEILASSISAKQTQKKEMLGIVYDFEVSASVEESNDELHFSPASLHYEDYFVVLKLADERLFLCNSIPGTFDISIPYSIEETRQSTVRISLRSLSGFIHMTLKESEG